MATALAAVGAHARRLRDTAGLHPVDLPDHRRPRRQYHRGADNVRVDRAGGAGTGPAADGRRRLAGVPVTKRPDPLGDSDHSGGRDGMRRGHRWRTHATGARSRRRGRGADLDRLWGRVGRRVGGAHDAFAPRDGGCPGRAGSAGGAADRVGVLQHLRLAYGRDDKRRPARAGDGVSDLHRGRLRHLGHAGTGQADAAIDDGGGARTRRSFPTRPS